MLSNILKAEEDVADKIISADANESMTKNEIRDNLINRISFSKVQTTLRNPKVKPQEEDPPALTLKDLSLRVKSVGEVYKDEKIIKKTQMRGPVAKERMIGIKSTMKKMDMKKEKNRKKKLLIEKKKLKSEDLEFLKMFRASIDEIRNSFRLSKKNDLAIICLGERACKMMSAYDAYKRKDKKVKPVDLSESDESLPESSSKGKTEIIKNEEKRYAFDPADKYCEYLIPRFFDLQRGARLIPDRLRKIRIKNELSDEEKKLLTEMLYRRKACLSGDFSEIEKVKPEVTPSLKIRTISHKAGQVPGFQIPRALNETVAQMIKKRLTNEVLESCYGSYRNPWFLVKKKETEKYRLVNAALKMNKVTIRNANLSSSIDDFSKQFAECMMTSLINLFFDYDQFSLAKTSRDLTTFQTLVDLIRMTTLSQGATNSVTQFMRVITRILLKHILKRASPFLNDVRIKRLKNIPKNHELIISEIRKGALNHIQGLNQVLADIKRAGCTIFDEKSQFCCAEIKVIGFVCDGERRHSNTVKIIKIVKGPACTCADEARGFIDVCVYYRIFIEDFAIMSEPIYRLLKKNVVFVGGIEQQEVMNVLKMKLVNPPALIIIDYESREKIIFAVNVNLKSGKEVFMQLLNGVRHPSRYESRMGNEIETKYDVIKRECREVLKCLKKFRYYLYEVHFTLKTDAEVLITQLNRSGIDLSGTLLTRGLAGIRLFDFDIKHVKGKKHIAADDLSRRPQTQKEKEEAAYEVDVDEGIKAELESLRSYANHIEEEDKKENVLNEAYSKESEQIARFLLTFRKSMSMTTKEFRKWKRKALNFKIQDDHFFRRNIKNVSLLRVIDDLNERTEIMKKLHDDTDHRGREGTHRRIADRYYGEGLYEDVQRYVKTCEKCQLRDPRREEEVLHLTWVSMLGEKIVIDVIHMPMDRGKNFLVIVRNDLSSGVKVRSLSFADSDKVAIFLGKDVVCRHECFGKLVLDDGPENRGGVAKLSEKYDEARVIVSAYHPQANGMVERRHKSLTDALSKMSAGEKEGGVQHLSAILWTDRSIVRASTGRTPFYLLCGSEAVLLIEMKYPTGKTLPWNNVRNRSDLLIMRARQLKRRDEDLTKTADMVRRKREKGKKGFDDYHETKERNIKKKNLVLMHDTQHEKDKNSKKKLNFRGKGSYRVAKAISEKGTYLLNELDDTLLKGTFADNRLKKFRSRASVNPAEDLISRPQLRNEVRPDFEEVNSESDDLSDSEKEDEPLKSKEDLVPSDGPLTVIIPSPLK